MAMDIRSNEFEEGLEKFLRFVSENAIEPNYISLGGMC